MYCNSCGREAKGKYCNNCGAELQATARGIDKPGFGSDIDRSGLSEWEGTYGSQSIPHSRPAFEREGAFFDVLLIWKSIKEIMLDPSRTFSRMPESGNISRAVVFSLITGVFFGIIGFFWELLGQSLLLPFMEDFSDYLFLMGGGILGFFYTLVSIPATVLIFIFAGGGFFHLALMLFGGGKPFI